MHILSDATNTKHMLYIQLSHKIEKLLEGATLFNNKSKADLADEILYDFYLCNEIFMLHILCCQEIDVYYALSNALNSYYDELNLTLDKKIQLEIYGYFNQASSPFSMSIGKVLENVDKTNEFLISN